MHVADTFALDGRQAKRTLHVLTVLPMCGEP